METNTFTLTATELVAILKRDYAEALEAGETVSPEDYAEWVRAVLAGERAL